MNKLFVIFFVVLSAPAILSNTIQLNGEFQNELGEISELLEENFNNIEDLKVFISQGIEDIKEDSDVDVTLKTQLEGVYDILNTINGPKDIGKLKKLRQELDKMVNMVEAAINDIFAKMVPQLSELEYAIAVLMQELKDAVTESAIIDLTSEIEEPVPS